MARFDDIPKPEWVPEVFVQRLGRLSKLPSKNPKIGTWFGVY